MNDGKHALSQRQRQNKKREIPFRQLTARSSARAVAYPWRAPSRGDDRPRMRRLAQYSRSALQLLSPLSAACADCPATTALKTRAMRASGRESSVVVAHAGETAEMALTEMVRYWFESVGPGEKSAGDDTHGHNEEQCQRAAFRSGCSVYCKRRRRVRVCGCAVNRAVSPAWPWNSLTGTYDWRCSKKRATSLTGHG